MMVEKSNLVYYKAQDFEDVEALSQAKDTKWGADYQRRDIGE
jgi:hypothetical protein